MFPWIFQFSRLPEIKARDDFQMDGRTFMNYQMYAFTILHSVQVMCSDDCLTFDFRSF